ncbi:LLM class flavin-dependent oxidoreductase [Streptosporangium sp. NPDC004379]|uniref:LLM class flavin-dependent oxidoreductase n=1 Tax=Streptosporangium sp. NPDC004379 TaxID=3366189 RepID=UPI00369F781F
MRLGVMFDRDLPPESLVPFCRHLDATEVDDVWVVEDLGWTGAISSAATALAVTSRVRVGIGITPAPLRNPVLLAMELGNLARMHPDRLAAGIGHGVQDWMRRAGAAAPSPLALLEETIVAVRALLRGETVTTRGRAVRLDGVRLVHPPAVPPPVLAGVLGPRSLELSGRVAQGTILPEGFGPERIAGARGLIGAGGRGRALPAPGGGVPAPGGGGSAPGGGPDGERGSAGGGDGHGGDGPGGGHEVAVFTHLYVDDDPARVREAVRPSAVETGSFLGVVPDEVPMAAGTAKTAAAHVRALWAAGAGTVVLRPVGDEPLLHVDRILAALRDG